MPSPVVFTMRPVVVADSRIDDLGTQRLEPAEGALLVGLDQVRIAGDVGREDRREPTFDASWPCGLHGASSVANDPIPSGARRALSMRLPVLGAFDMIFG